jgi:hypothetical protein
VSPIPGIANAALGGRVGRYEPRAARGGTRVRLPAKPAMTILRRRATPLTDLAVSLRPRLPG